MPEMTPIDRLLGLPASLFAALDHLPAIARNTNRMEDHTANLRDMTDILERVAADTQVLGPMDGRMANIEKTMPILVEVQRHLAQLPETIAALDDRIERLSAVLERMLD